MKRMYLNTMNTNTEKTIVYILDKTNAVTEKTLKPILSFIPESRLRTAEKYLHREDYLNSVLSYFLLIYGMRKLYHMSLPEIAYGPYGKAYFKDSEIHFNISHSEGVVCCGLSDSPIGVDIQTIIHKYADITDMVLSENEKMLVNRTGNPENAFTRIWCLKESHLKCIGTGLNNDLCSLDFADCNTGFFTKYGRVYTTSAYPGFFLGVCSDHKALLIKNSLTDYLDEYVMNAEIMKMQIYK